MSKSVLYIRVPISLKKRVKQASKDAKVSCNKFMMTCFESHLNKGVKK